MKRSKEGIVSSTRGRRYTFPHSILNDAKVRLRKVHQLKSRKQVSQTLLATRLRDTIESG